ncbi:hypothetical protein Tco_0617044 [Tanacetum coccineum]
MHSLLLLAIVGEKYKIVAQVKKYLTYYALANGFSLWHERSGEERVVAKYGQRLPKMSAPEKGMVKTTFKPLALSRGTLKTKTIGLVYWISRKKTWVQQRQWANSKSDQHKVIYLKNKVPESYVPALFETDMYFVAYHNYVKPVPGMNFWPNQSMYSTVLPPKPRKMPGMPKKKIIRAIVEQTPKPKRGPGRPRKKQLVDDLEDVDAHRGPVRDEGASGTRRGVSRTRGGAIGSKGRRGRGAAGSRGGTSGSIGRGAGGSKRKLVSTAGTQKRQEQTQAAPQQTQHEPEQTQVEDQVEQPEDQTKIDLTQQDQVQEPTQEPKNNHSKLH